MTYELNNKAFYAPYSKHQELITQRDLTELHITVQDNNQKSNGFDVKVPEAVFDHETYIYLKHGDFYDAGGFQSARSAYNWGHDPLSLWEVQLNFAVHCATSALGVSTEHLNAKQSLVKSLYRFHVYYHVRRILRRMAVPTPSDEGFDKYNNAYNLKEARRIADEYGCSSNFHLYRNELYFERTGLAGNYHYSHNNWSRWIMPRGRGFTKAGLEKISESIRAYTYLVLTSQVAARHGILGDTAPSIAAQRLFYDNLEDVINKAVSLEADIARYQNVLKYARSTLDFSVGKQLYMLPSDMLLKPLNTVIEGYNDKIVVNTSGFELGKVKASKPKARRRSPCGSAGAAAQGATKPKVVPPIKRRVHTLDDHEDEKTALVLGMLGVTLFAVWYF